MPKKPKRKLTQHETRKLYDRIVILNYRVLISQFNEYARNDLKLWLNSIIAQTSEHETAMMLDRAVENGLILTSKYVYNRQRLFEYMSNMVDYLP